MRDALFQSEHHPLVTTDPASPEQLALTLIHRKAYVQARDSAEGLAVLDLGCNTGYGTRLIAESARHVCGVDVSPRAIEHARRTAAASNVRYELSDGASLRFEDGSFDMVTSFQVIEHVEQVGRYLAEIRRVLKPGGRAVFTTPNGTLRLLPGRPPWNIFHLREFSASELRAELAGHFDEVRILGLFAEDPLRETELRRIARAQQISRSRLLLALKKFVLTQLGDSVQRRIEALVSSRSAARGDAADAAPGWTLDCLDYRKSDLDSALDFMAICHKAR